VYSKALAAAKSMFGPQDMTVGKPVSVMLKFTIPLLLGNIAQIAYNFVDSIIVGQYNGPDALSAIGVTMSIQFMFAVFFMTFGTGVSIMVSQYFGAKDKENLSKTCGQALILILLATAFAMVLGLILSDPILRAINCPENVFQNASTFQRIMFIGFIGMGFYNVLSGVLRGLGDSTYPLIILLGCTVLNIVLAIWFVAPPEKLWGIGLGQGVAGSAWATVIAQTLSAVVCLIRLLRMKDIVTINRASMKLTKRIVGQIVRIGVPSGIQQLIMSFSFVLVQSLINKVVIPFNLADGSQASYAVRNSIFVAVNTAVMRVDSVAMMPAQTFNQVASTYTGQNIGAGKIDRVMKGTWTCLAMAVGISAVVVIAILVFGESFYRLFINAPDPLLTEKIVQVSVQMMHVMVIGYIIMAVANTIGGVMRGAGDTMAQLFIMVATNIVIRIPLTYIMVHLSKTPEYPEGKPEVFFITMLIAFGLNVIASCVYFATGKWKTKSVVQQKLPEPV
jgi:putative MATE family efflux protein